MTSLPLRASSPCALGSAAFRKEPLMMSLLYCWATKTIATDEKFHLRRERDLQGSTVFISWSAVRLQVTMWCKP
uniref:Uncharacterized protein n=1 Tax=Anguilla anguilla TaxID=7936 RepID=A0A0E9XCY6_ANGAN